MPDNKTEHSCDDLLERIRGEILPLFDKAISDNTVFYHNPHLVVCKSKKQCSKDTCPCFKDEAQRCWQIAGTYCAGKIQGAFAEKYHNCKECDVFTDACPTIVEELGEYFNNMMLLLRRKEQSLTTQNEKIEYLNRKLLSSVESLDARNREIHELVITDKLTGLYNRHYLVTSLEEEIHRCSRNKYMFSVIMLDIDDFKKINDTYGHLAGDAVLSKLGALLKNQVRNYDRCYRYGGEEFVCLLPETDLTMAWILAERLREGFAQEEFSFNPEADAPPETVACTLSIGCVSYSSGTTADKLLKQADDALYEAKRRGKNNTVRFDEL